MVFKSGICTVHDATPDPLVTAEQFSPPGDTENVSVCPPMVPPVTFDVSVAVIVTLRPVRTLSVMVVALAVTLVGAWVTVRVPGTNVLNE